MVRLFRFGAAAIVGLALVAMTGRQASANQMYAATWYNGVTGNLTANIQGIGGVSGNNDSSYIVDFYSRMGVTGTVGATLATLPGPSFKTYCVDLANSVNPNYVDKATVSFTAGTSLDGNSFNRNIGAAGWVVQNYGATLGVLNTSSAWSALYTAAGLTSQQMSNFTYGDQVAVVQTAVWVLAYGASTAANTSTGSYVSGQSPGNDSALINQVLWALESLASGKTQAVGFINYPPPPIPGATPNQDMLYKTPEPTSLAIAGLGVLGLIGYGLRRKRA